MNKKSIRAWEASIEIGVWRWNFNLALSPLVWRKWVCAVGNECWSTGSLFHLFVGPVHIWIVDFDAYLFTLRLDVTKNGWWWDKPIKNNKV